MRRAVCLRPRALTEYHPQPGPQAPPPASWDTCPPSPGRVRQRLNTSILGKGHPCPPQSLQEPGWPTPAFCAKQMEQLVTSLGGLWAGTLVWLEQLQPQLWSGPCLPAPDATAAPAAGGRYPPDQLRSQPCFLQACPAACDGGIQTRGRSCSGSASGDAECPGPHSQARDGSTQPCTAQCPGDMVFRSVRQCRQEGGPCPRLCLVQGPGVECAGLCSPGCTCPAGLFLHDASCLPCSQCPCQLHGQLCAPGEVAQLDSCNNCTCISGAMVCTSEPCPGQLTWSPWTPWSDCSASCSPALRHQHRFCPGPTGAAPSSVALLPPPASPSPLCPGPEAEEEPCLLLACDRAGGWGPWGPWSSCSRSCGGGLRSQTRACDQPPPQGLGDDCEGPRAQGEVCQALPCPVTNCTAIPRAEDSPCGPPVLAPVTISW
ncbi:Sco-Spondin [Manis pentadactyla]|nr:Sco-Spondin [Manis pentadactyla]